MQTHKKLRHLIHIFFRGCQILAFADQSLDVFNQLVTANNLIFHVFRRMLQVDNRFGISQNNHGAMEVAKDFSSATRINGIPFICQPQLL